MSRCGGLATPPPAARMLAAHALLSRPFLLPLVLKVPSTHPQPQRLLSYQASSDVLFGGSGSGGGEEARAALAAAVSRLLSRLVENLEAKSRGYRGEPALAALFMMNNVHYLQWSVEGSAALGLLGREWLEAHKDAVEDWGARYQEVAWGPLLALLQVRRRQEGCARRGARQQRRAHRQSPRAGGLAPASLRAASSEGPRATPQRSPLHLTPQQAEPPSDVGKLKTHLKETFASFNAGLERIYGSQSAWTIPDGTLRDAVRRVVKNDVVAPYQAFLRR